MGRRDALYRRLDIVHLFQLPNQPVVDKGRGGTEWLVPFVMASSNRFTDNRHLLSSKQLLATAAAMPTP